MLLSPPSVHTSSSFSKDLRLMFTNTMDYVGQEFPLHCLAQTMLTKLQDVLLEHCPPVPSHHHLIAALPLANTTLIVAPNISMAEVCPCHSH